MLYFYYQTDAIIFDVFRLPRSKLDIFRPPWPKLCFPYISDRGNVPAIGATEGKLTVIGTTKESLIGTSATEKKLMAIGATEGKLTAFGETEKKSNRVKTTEKRRFERVRRR